jgi:hypothetical protein
MNRYIDADAVLTVIEDALHRTDAEGEEQIGVLTCHRIVRTAPTADVVKIPEGGIGNLSDGYHTFNELYHHRAILFSVICNAMPAKAWKSKLHDTGDMFEGMFIVGIETPEGQATYHYDIDPYWDMFKVKELEKAPKYDGHTPSDAIKRIGNLTCAGYRKQSELTPCDVCKFNPPTSGDGKPCFMCPSQAKMKGGAE